MKKSKLAVLKECAAAQKWQEAIAIAAKFPQLDEARADILAAHGAYTNARFYEQIGKDIQALKEKGIAALCKKYGLG